MFIRSTLFCAVLLVLASSEANAQTMDCTYGGICPSMPCEPQTCSKGSCDNAYIRDSWEHFNTEKPMSIRIKFIIFGDGDEFIVSGDQLNPQFQVLNEDFEDYGIQFVELNGRRYEHNTAYYDLCGNCDLPADYDDGCCYHWRSMCRGDCDGAQSCSATEESAMKDQYADEPEYQLNIYIVNNEFMNLAGLSYFPWCDDSTGDRGGIIMHHTYVGGNGDCNGQRCTMLTHEVGHALGLWHTHHGVTEVDECSMCYEYADGTGCSTAGDFCCDTPATPYNSTCSEPSGSDCYEDPWGDTDETNHMGLGPQGCSDHFTPEQARRMHCWVCNSNVASWIESPDCNNNDVPDVCEITSGNADDCNTNGVPDECDIMSEHSLDCDENDVPDDCQSSTMPVKACCYGGDSCMETTECHCDEISGQWTAWSTCALSGCATNP